MSTLKLFPSSWNCLICHYWFSISKPFLWFLITLVKMGPHKYRRNFFFEVFNGRSNYMDLGLCITARPAPRTARPLAGLPNPYPYGCSVLCNHPKDPELKDVVWRPRISSVLQSTQLLPLNYCCFCVFLFLLNGPICKNYF